jgi:hypothetical protein
MELFIFFWVMSLILAYNLGARSIKRITKRPKHAHSDNGAPVTPKPNIIPKPSFPLPRIIKEDLF